MWYINKCKPNICLMFARKRNSFCFEFPSSSSYFIFLSFVFFFNKLRLSHRALLLSLPLLVIEYIRCSMVGGGGVFNFSLFVVDLAMEFLTLFAFNQSWIKNSIKKVLNRIGEVGCRREGDWCTCAFNTRFTLTYFNSLTKPTLEPYIGPDNAVFHTRKIIASSKSDLPVML